MPIKVPGRGVMGERGATGATGVTGAQGPTGATGPAGAAGESAPTSGRLEFIGNLNVGDGGVLTLGVGMKRKTFPLAGVGANDRLQFSPTAAPTSGCEVVNVYPASAGNVSVGYYTPALGLGASFTMPIAVYRVTQ